MAKSTRAPKRAPKKRASKMRAPARVSKKRASKTRAPARVTRKAVVKKKTAAKKQVAGSPHGAKRNAGTTDRPPRVPLRVTRATSKKKAVTANEARANVVVLDGRRLSRRIEFTPRLVEDIRRRYEEMGEGPDVLARSVGVAKATIQRLVREQAWTRGGQGPRDLSRAEQLAAEVRALAARAAANAASTLPPRALSSPPPERGRSDGETVRVGVTSGAALTPSLTLPLSGGGNESAVPPGQDAAPDEEPVDFDAQIERLTRLVAREIGVYENLRAQLGNAPQAQREVRKTINDLGALTSTLDTLRRIGAGQTAIAPHDGYDDDFPTDIDALRDALARRIEAFFANRRDEGDAGGPAAAPADGA